MFLTVLVPHNKKPAQSPERVFFGSDFDSAKLQ